ETIHDYYVRFAKLINDMRNIKMTMSRMQLNSKFLNNMLPEWDRFVTVVKLNRGLRDSNFDQLYAYLKQHEAHANENKMMLDRFTQHTMDPLALMSNVSHQQYYSQSSSTPPSTYVPPHLADNAHLDSGLSSTDNLIENLTNTFALLTQSYQTFLPQINNQLRTSSNTRNQATVQDGRIVVQNVQGRQNRGQARQVKCYNCNGIRHIARNCTQPKRPHNSYYYKDKMLLMQARENGVVLDKEQLLFLAGGQDNAIDEDVDEQHVQDLALTVDNVFQVDDYDVFDSDVNEALTAQTMFMANLSSADPVYDKADPSYDSNILSEVHDHDHCQDAVCEHHEEHAMHDNVQLNHVDDSHVNYMSDRNMILYDQYVKDNAVPVVENSLTAELAIYKEQVKLYERWSRPKPYYNELNKVAIGYKIPLCLTRAKQVQPTLYNGHEIIKDNHVRAIVHNTEDILEIAKITRRKMNDKMKDPECVTHKVKIAPHGYSKENFLATFTPQKQLTPEQVFWSQDLIKMKTKALKEQTTASRPIKALTVFEGIQKALTKEIKDMKDVFEELEAEVAQNVVDRKHDEIKRKNLLIANDNLIAECLSNEVIYVATNSELNVARFTEMHVANIIVEARCLELEAELSTLRDKSHNDNHNELVNRFSNLEHYKELYDYIKITRAKHIEQVTALTTENVNLKAQILNMVNSVGKDHVKPIVLAPGKYAIDVEPLLPHHKNNREAHLDCLRHLKESVKTIREIVEEAKVVRPLDSSIVSTCRYTKHSQKLLEYAIGTCLQDSHPRDKKHAPDPFKGRSKLLLQNNMTRVNNCTDASGLQPKSNTKKNKISPAKGVNKMNVEEHPKTNKSHLRTSNRVDSSSRPKRTVKEYQKRTKSDQNQTKNRKRSEAGRSQKQL
nr:hypothetical protein [Tanacetum cinerariifolium]